MGSSGHRFIAHTKALSPAAQVSDAGYGLPPHPTAARPGQRYWPRTGRRRELVVRGVRGEHAILAERAPGSPRRRVALRRLLAVRADGQGAHFQFHGYLPRRYETTAEVTALHATTASLRLPEWHPDRPARIPARLLPAQLRAPGARVTLRADLSASSAARLALSDLRPASR